MDTRIANIPCKVEITRYYKYRAATIWGHPDGWAPGEPDEISFQVLDRRGRVAPWLEEKLDEQDRRRIEEELRAHLKHEQEIGDY